MSDALDILTRGLTQATGLSVSTRGLLLSASGPGIASAAVAPLDPSSITDAALLLAADVDVAHVDLGVDGGQLVPDHGLVTSVALSLFTDRLAESDDRLPTPDGDRRGWWADSFPVVFGDRWGSRLWLLHREKQTQQTLNRAEEYVRESLEWLVEDGIASAVEVSASWLAREVMAIEVSLLRPTEVAARMRWAVAWEAMQ